MKRVFRRHTVDRYEGAEAGPRSVRGCLRGSAGIVNAPTAWPRLRCHSTDSRVTGFAFQGTTARDRGIPRVVVGMPVGPRQGMELSGSEFPRQHEQLVVYLRPNRHVTPCEMPTRIVGGLASQYW